MVITETSSFKSNLVKRQEGSDPPHSIDRNQDKLPPSRENSELFTRVPNESTPPPKGDGFFYKRRRLPRGGVAFLQEEKPQDLSSDVVRGLNRCATSTSSTKAPTKGNVPSKSSKTSSIQKISRGMLNHISCKKLCISILKDSALLGDWGQCTSLGTFDRDKTSTKASLPCEACGIMEESLKMLICDCCEAAYHLSCCNIERKTLGEDEDWHDWYCLPCLQSNLESETSGDGKKILKNAIRAMLGDKRSYRTGVRVGRDFQADVPHWTGPIYDDSSAYFSKPKELDVASDSTSKLWCKRPKSRSFGNWVQCREIIHARNNDEGTICGKWRRVPIEVVQTDDWDCSCLLPHDPFHADCAVPQEAGNEEVFKQLKFLESARWLLESRTKKS